MSTIYTTAEANILRNPGSSYFLKASVREQTPRDVQDALCDAEILLSLAQARAAAAGLRA